MARSQFKLFRDPLFADPCSIRPAAITMWKRDSVALHLFSNVRSMFVSLSQVKWHASSLFSWKSTGCGNRLH